MVGDGQFQMVEFIADQSQRQWKYEGRDVNLAGINLFMLIPVAIFIFAFSEIDGFWKDRYGLYA